MTDFIVWYAIDASAANVVMLLKADIVMILYDAGVVLSLLMAAQNTFVADLRPLATLLIYLNMNSRS